MDNRKFKIIEYKLKTKTIMGQNPRKNIDRKKRINTKIMKKMFANINSFTFESSSEEEINAHLSRVRHYKRMKV